MCNHSTLDGFGRDLPATQSGPRTGDFPLSSTESHAAARILAQRQEAQGAKYIQRLLARQKRESSE